MGAVFAMLWVLKCFLAASVFDSEMTDQEKKDTGIYKLDDQEKAALQNWVDTKCQSLAAQKASALPPPKKLPSLSENLLGSQYLRLSDNTLWKVRPEDIAIAQGWITPVEIIVTSNRNTFFPFTLTNTLTGSSVQARQADALPPQPPSSPNPNQQWLPPTQPTPTPQQPPPRPPMPKRRLP